MQTKLSKNEILGIIKALYLTPNEDNNRKYSLREIAKIMQDNHEIATYDYTICKMAKKYGWDDEFQNLKNQGVLKAIKESKDIDKTIEDNTRNLIADNYKRMIGLKNNSLSELEEKFKTDETKKKIKIPELINIITMVDTSLAKNPIEKTDTKPIKIKINYGAD